MCIHIYIYTPVFSFLLVQSCSHNCLRLIVDVSSFISVYLPPGRSKSLASAPRIQRFPNQWTTDHLGTQRGHRRPKKLSETSISNHLNGRLVVFQDLKHVGVQIGYRPKLDETEHDQSVCVAMGSVGPSTYPTYPWLLVGKRKRFAGKCPHLYHLYIYILYIHSYHLNWWLFHEDKNCRGQTCLTGMEASGLPSCPEEWSQNLFETPQAPEDQESMPKT